MTRLVLQVPRFHLCQLNIDNQRQSGRWTVQSIPEWIPARILSWVSGLCGILNILHTKTSSRAMLAISLAWRMPFSLGTPDTTISENDKKYIKAANYNQHSCCGCNFTDTYKWNPTCTQSVASGSAKRHSHSLYQKSIEKLNHLFNLKKAISESFVQKEVMVCLRRALHLRERAPGEFILIHKYKI